MFSKHPIGHPFTDADGIDKQLVLEVRDATYPYTHRVREISAEPTEQGRRTAAYREQRSRLGDDWLSDFTASERLLEVLQLAGATWQEIADCTSAAVADALAGDRP